MKDPENMNRYYMQYCPEELEEMIAHSPEPDWCYDSLEALAYKRNMEKEWDEAETLDDFVKVYEKKYGAL